MDARDDKDGEGCLVQVSAKKPYAEPVLLEWGSFEDLTLAVGNLGARDGGTKHNRTNTRS